MDEIELFHISCIEYQLVWIDPIEGLSFSHSSTLGDSKKLDK
jgi:hypothetical protein